MNQKIMLCVLLLFSAVTMSAQSKVSGKVVDKKGNPIPGAKVEITNTGESVLTDLDGTFTIESTMTSHIYAVKVYYVGMQSKRQKAEDGMLVVLSPTRWWNKAPENWQYFGALQGAFPESGAKNFSLGISGGYVKDYGVYGKVLFRPAQSTIGDIGDDDSSELWTTGEYKNSLTAFIVGGMYRLYGPFYINLGVGYMMSKVAWENSDGDYLKYTENSYNGVCVDAGLTIRCGNHFLLNGGIVLTQEEYARAPYIGIGYCF